MATNSKATTLPMSMRSEAMESTYARAKEQKKLKKLLDEERLGEWEHWVLIENAFPYDMVFSTHHLLVPRREVEEEKLSKAEKSEMQVILKELSNKYDAYLVNFKSMQSIKYHYHVHLLVYKRSRDQIRI